jgi:hypothetical protein
MSWKTRDSGRGLSRSNITVFVCKNWKKFEISYRHFGDSKSLTDADASEITTYVYEDTLWDTLDKTRSKAKWGEFVLGNGKSRPVAAHGQ